MWGILSTSGFVNFQCGKDSGLERPERHLHYYITQSIFKIVLQKSLPTQIRHLILYTSNSTGYVDGFVGDLTSAKQFKNTFCKVK